MMGYYLLDRPNKNYKQYRETRRNGGKPSGTVVLHTAENVTDVVGADAGAEGVAAFIASRTSAGSYHVLCDSDSTIHMLPWAYEAWQDTRTNNWAVGISAAISCKDWNRLGDRGLQIVSRMAHAAREYSNWLVSQGKPEIPARRLSRAQALNREAGFIGHGEIDPGRRSDPGADFPWDYFFTVYRASGSSPSPTPINLNEVELDEMLLIHHVNGQNQAFFTWTPLSGFALVPASPENKDLEVFLKTFKPIRVEGDTGLHPFIRAHEAHVAGARRLLGLNAIEDAVKTDA